MKKTILSSLLALPFLFSADAQAQRHDKGGYGYGKAGYDRGGHGKGGHGKGSYNRTSGGYRNVQISHTVDASRNSYRPHVSQPNPKVETHKNAEVHKMIRQLKGASGKVSQKKRSVEIHSSIAPRGLSPRSGRYEYQVDEASRLATTEVKFIKGSTSLADRASNMYLRNLAQALLDNDLVRGRYIIEGHASAEGSSSSNQKLSQRRANAIFDYLVGQGVPAHRLIAVGHGESQARFPSVSPDYLLSQDRRVMVYKLIR